MNSLISFHIGRKQTWKEHDILTWICLLVNSNKKLNSMMGLIFDWNICFVGLALKELRCTVLCTAVIWILWLKTEESLICFMKLKWIVNTSHLKVTKFYCGIHTHTILNCATHSQSRHISLSVGMMESRTPKLARGCCC